MDRTRYLQRIRYKGPLEPTAETLRSLHRSHMETVPFENLDIHLGRQIALDEGAFYRKIVGNNRGGFCYELNGLFASLLRSLGFRVTLLSARVFSGDTPGPDFDHMALLVDLDERWLADVGFGDSFVEPLLLDDNGEQVQGGTGYRIQAEEKTWSVWARKPAEKTWTASYQFDLTPRSLSDFAPMCHWQQTDPASHFTQKRICSMASRRGRTTLSDMRLITTIDGNREERILQESEYAKALETCFGIVIP